MTGEVRPFLVPEPSVVTWSSWRLLEGDHWIELPDLIDGWDSGTDLRISRTVRIDTEDFESQTGVSTNDVVLAVSWTSSTTAMTDAALPATFTNGEATCDVTMLGSRLSGILSIRSTISLARSVTRTAAGVAMIPGSVLAEDKQLVAVEDLTPMFPIHELDFAHTRLPALASWHLETTTDLTAPFFARFRILINSHDKELSAAAARGAKDRRQQALLDELEAGVASEILELALMMREELLDRDHWPPDSVGDVLGRVLDTSMLDLNAPPTPDAAAAYRTQVAASVRNAGKGRQFE